MFEMRNEQTIKLKRKLTKVIFLYKCAILHSSVIQDSSPHSFFIEYLNCINVISKKKRCVQTDNECFDKPMLNHGVENYSLNIIEILWLLFIT